MPASNNTSSASPDLLQDCPIDVPQLLTDLRKVRRYLYQSARTSHHFNLLGQLKYLLRNLDPLLDEPAERPKAQNRLRKGGKWDRARMRALVRDDFRCRECGCDYYRRLTVHHVAHIADGGDNNLANLLTLCNDCHTALHEQGVALTNLEMLEAADDGITSHVGEKCRSALQGS